MNRLDLATTCSPRWRLWAVLPMALIALTALRSDAAEPSGDTAKGPAAKPPAILKYGDGKADGRKSIGGSGEMIRFEMPEGVSAVRGLRIHGSRYGTAQAPDEDFEITFLGADGDEVLDSRTAPYHLFKRGNNRWTRVLFDKPVELSPGEKFWVVLNFNAAQTKGVYVSYDTSTGGEHSRVGLPGDDNPPKETDFHGDWMVQAMLSRPGR